MKICFQQSEAAGAGFGTDTNIVTLITRDNAVELPIMSKDKVAKAIVDEIINSWQPS